METTIDSAGRVIIPKKIREQAAVRPGAALEARYEDGRIVLEPKPIPVRVVQRGRFAVAVPESAGEQLTTGTVEETRSKLRQERGGGED